MALSMAVADRVRADLLAIMGQEAWLEPALASLFQPYQREFPNLDPGKQVEVQKLIQRYFLAHEQQFRQLVGFVNRNEHLARLTMRIEGRQTSLKLYDAELTRLLGRERHIEFISQIDPVYGSLAALARSKAVAPEKVNVVYAATFRRSCWR